MAKRRFRPEDAYRLKFPAEPDLSPDGERVAFVIAETDEETDRLTSSIWVAAVDGSDVSRFTDGPADKTPRFSPDGCSLAYISVIDDQPRHAHVRVASLTGGAPRHLGELPGPVTQFVWSPDSERIVAVCNVGLPDPDKQSAKERNAPRVVRGLAARLDGFSWRDGRRHLFTIDVEDGSTTQLTRGDYDHADPNFSPDGATIAFTSDRSPRRDDRQFYADVFVMPAAGGRARRLTDGNARAVAPAFSPDGRSVAFAGQDTFSWDGDARVYAVPADGGEPTVVAPESDRGVVLAPGVSPFRWSGEAELLMLVMDRGTFTLQRARLTDARSREVVGGDRQIDGLATNAGRGVVAYTAGWLDRPGELYVKLPRRAEPVQLTRLHEGLLAEVELSPVARASVARPDGTEVEYFTLLPGGAGRRRLPLHVDIHGGPHGLWPVGKFLGLHQAVAAAGYALVLPNPRGSTSYGQKFTSACTGDWGGADCDDILACCDDVIARGIADEKRMFVSGGSYGGFMTSWIVGHSRRFRAATAVAAVVDMTNQALASDIPEFAVYSMGGTPWEQPGEYEKRSPLTYLPEVRTPLLVIHWEGDIRVPISQGEEIYTGLRLLGRETELVRYPGGCHTQRTPSQAVDWARRMLAWNAVHDVRGSGRP